VAQPDGLSWRFRAGRFFIGRLAHRFAGDRAPHEEELVLAVAEHIENARGPWQPPPV
jgi:hypothetical protein